MDEDKDLKQSDKVNEDKKIDITVDNEELKDTEGDTISADGDAKDADSNNEIADSSTASDETTPVESAEKDAFSEEQRINEELGRIEGIDTDESASTPEKTAEEETSTPEESEPPVGNGSHPIKNSLDDDHETPVPFGSDIVEKARLEAKQSHEGNKKSVIVIVGLALLAVLAAVAAVYFYYQQNTVADQLNVTKSEVTQLHSDNTKLQKQYLDAKKNAQAQVDAAKEAAKKQTAATEDASQYAQIREFGVRYKLTDANKTLIYAYAPTGDGMYFSTTPLAGLKDTTTGANGKATETHPCSFQETTNLPMIMVSPTKPANATIVKQVGSNFFSYMQPQAACSTQMTSEQQAVNKAVSELVSQLEPIAGAATTK